MKTDEVKQLVRKRYGGFAVAVLADGATLWCLQAQPGSGYAPDQGLYSEEELDSIPPLALALSRGCGNPTSFARLQEGETAADLGCGGGIDLILASRRVGPGGRVMGVDFTPEMLERARLCVEEAGLENVELFTGDLESLPLPNECADAVISNCVINLVPDKEAAYREAFRVLRPGGRIAISDIVTSSRFDPDLKARFQGTWAGCLGGAMEEGPYLGLIEATGFHDREIIARHTLSPEELEAMAQCPGSDFTPPPLPEDLAAVVGKVLSIKFRATRWGAGRSMYVNKNSSLIPKFNK